ncbi:hypothetical protein Dimus_012445 [Dionaea muscipula]
MVVNMIRWPWPPLSRRVEALITVHCLKGLQIVDDRDDDKGLQKMGGLGRLVVEVRWKGSKSTGLRGLRKKVMKNYTREEGLNDDGILQWDEEFRAVCTFSGSKEDAFQPWEVTFVVFHGLSERSKKRILFAGPAVLNIAENGTRTLRNEKALEIHLPIALPFDSAKCCPTLCVSLNLTELRTGLEAPEAVPRPLISVPLSPCFGAPQTLENDEPSTLKASLRKVNMLTKVISSRKVKSPSPGEFSSDGGKCSTGTGSEDSEYTYPFYVDSFDDTDEEDSEESSENTDVRKTVSYGTLISANLARGAFGSRIYGEDGEQLYYSNHKLEVSCEDNAQEPAVEQSARHSPKLGILSWRKKKTTGYKSPKNKGEPLLKKEHSEVGGDDIDFDRRQLDSSDESSFRMPKPKEDLITPVSEFGDDNFVIGSWELKEILSRDGSLKLQAQVFFASIDQRHEKAAGESACTALVTVIADHLLENHGEVPIKSEFDSLIREGSLQWRKLCENEAYREQFPDKHFDLETVLQAKIRPLFIEPDKSFVGFFHPEGIQEERFGFLQGAMSFDGIWDEICQIASDCSDPLLYIVSWNDHFFVLKVDSDAFYIIDTLGERLFEGCKQAYVLKFDKESMITRSTPPPHREEDRKAADADPDAEEAAAGNSKPEKENHEYDAIANEVASASASPQESSSLDASDLDEEKEKQMMVICKGKESCKEYIKSFLAAIPIRELQADIKRGLMASTPLHHRLQIEFHHMQLFSSPAAAAEYDGALEAGKAAVAEPATSS